MLAWSAINPIVVIRCGRMHHRAVDEVIAFVGACFEAAEETMTCLPYVVTVARRNARSPLTHEM